MTAESSTTMRAIPKSAITALSAFSFTSIFCGFKSRCMILFRCMYLQSLRQMSRNSVCTTLRRKSTPMCFRQYCDKSPPRKTGEMSVTLPSSARKISGESSRLRCRRATSNVISRSVAVVKTLSLTFFAKLCNRRSRDSASRRFHTRLRLTWRCSFLFHSKHFQNSFRVYSPPPRRCLPCFLQLSGMQGIRCKRVPVVFFVALALPLAANSTATLASCCRFPRAPASRRLYTR